MTENAELRRVPAFAGLPDDQIAWFISEAEELRFKGGETLMTPGDPADAMFVLLEGQLQARGEFGGETMIISVNAGQVTGRLPFSRMKTFTFGARSVIDTASCDFPNRSFTTSCRKCPSWPSASSA